MPASVSLVTIGLLLTPPLPFASCAWVRAENDAAGAGFVVDTGRRLLVTCRHVVADRATVEVFFPWHRDGELVTDKRDYLGNRSTLRERGLLVRGKVLRRSDAADLALVELESLPPGTRAVPLAAVPARPGDSVRVIGHRQDLDTLWNVTTGPVRQTGRLADGYPWRGTKLAVGADALIGQWPTEEGDSGGPVLNARGEAVGMATALRRGTPLAAVAVSAAEIRRLVEAEEGNAKSETPAVAESLFRATVWVRPTATDVHTAGVLVDRERGWVLTSSRGVGPADRVGVAFPLRDGGRWVGEREPYRDPVGLHLRGAWRAATVIARDPARDLALLQLDSVPESARAVPVAANPPAPGTAVHVMNHPGGLEFAWVYASCSVRQCGRLALAAGDDPPRVAVTVLQVPAQARSPGGPVLNGRGELIGVLAAREGPHQVGYAAATEDVARFLDGIPPDRPARTEFDRTKLLASAAVSVKKSDWRAARGDLERILDVDPADAEARQKLVRPLLELGKDTAAAAAVRDTLRVDPRRLPSLAADLVAQADRLAVKFPETPSQPVGWLVRALTAAAPVLPAPRKADTEAALKRAAGAKDDAERLTVLREFVAKLVAGR